MTFKKLNHDFPIFIWENFETINDSNKFELMEIVLENKKRNHMGIGGSFKIDSDPTLFFSELYSKFFSAANDFFGKLSILENNSPMCWSYSSNNIDHGFGIIHNHIPTSTINSVYYLNVPSSATIIEGSIQFFLEDKEFSYKPNNFDLIMFPNYLDHKINYLSDPEYRISINMEILCEEDPVKLFSKDT